MTKEQWVHFCKLLQAGDILYFESKDLTGLAITFGTGDGSNLDPAHVAVYLGDGVGKTVEADPKGTNYHCIDEYKDRVLKNKMRIVVDRVRDLTVEELEMAKDGLKEQIGKPYGWGAITGYGLYRLVRDTPIGFLINLFRISNPLSNKKSPVCSQVAYLMLEKIPRIEKILKENLKYEDATPEALSNKTPDFCIREMDTLRIDKYNIYSI